MEECSEFFRHNPKLKLEQLSIDELIASALSFKVTRKLLTKMEQERHLEVFAFLGSVSAHVLTQHL